MNVLQLLIEIQKNKKIIEVCNNITKSSEYTYTLKKAKEEFNIEKGKFKNKDNEIVKTREKYQTVNNNINNDKKELEEIKFELYNNAGSDLKLIDSLQKKLQIKQEIVKLLDSESLELLEIEEKLCLEKESLRLKLSHLKNKFYEYKEEENKKINEGRKELEKAENNIKKIEKTIPVDILKSFNDICSFKGMGAAELKNGICSGCKVKVSSMTIDNVNREEKIVYCDNCGRIIYCNEKKSF
jgi:predicted  nucleic acid-binding Zn-ribbon protein